MSVEILPRERRQAGRLDAAKIQAKGQIIDTPGDSLYNANSLD
jgi:hypothetical protein